jgi:phospholipid/cholesterol/gamma-HCH transport system substrate-binding protein
MPVKANRIIRVIVIIIVALATSTLLYLLINNFQFTRGLEVRVHFKQIGDLNVGAWIRKSGIKVGSVTRLEPAEDETTIIATLTFRPGQIVRRDDRFSLIAKGILGDMYIEQHPGPKESPLVEQGHIFEGEPTFNITDLLGGDTMGMVSDLAGTIKGILDVLKRNQDTLDTTIKDVQKTASNVRIVTDRAVTLTESVPEIAGQIASSIDELQSTVRNVATTTQKLVGKLESDLTESADNLSATMETVRRVSDDIQTAVGELTAQDSVIGTLSSPKISSSLETTVKNLEEISKNLLTVTRDTEKIVKGVREIFEAK